MLLHFKPSLPTPEEDTVLMSENITPSVRLQRTCVRSLVGLQGFLPGKHPVADVTADVAGRALSFIYQLSNSLSPRAPASNPILKQFIHFSLHISVLNMYAYPLQLGVIRAGGFNFAMDLFFHVSISLLHMYSTKL